MLSNKRSLRYLNLKNTQMSANLCQSILQQLTDIIHLEYLNMSNSNLSQVSNFMLNNSSCLRYLRLKNLHMSSTLYHSICQQLTDFENIEQFVVSRQNSCYQICGAFSLTCYLSATHLPTDACRRVFHQINRYSDLRSIEITDSPLTGCLSSFLSNPHPGLPKLYKLKLNRTSLNKEDVQHLLSIAYKLPTLQGLDLSSYTLTGCLSRFLTNPHPGIT